ASLCLRACVCLYVCLPNAAVMIFYLSECGGNLDASEAGYITSPGYPLEYPPHQNCHWIITAPEPSQRIVLNFNPHFEIERLDCKYDFIEIRDGTSDTADVLGRHCSNIAPAPIISSGSSIQIRFVSDYAHQGAGFSLRYEIFRTGEPHTYCKAVTHTHSNTETHTGDELNKRNTQKETHWHSSTY
uniref:CUB domain-containing protein n=1 Tax=Monopterus albus TaxID=43700 RepID=A0A3Q3JBD6_MONAL